MFTGIIENLSKVEKVEKEQSNLHLTFSNVLTPQLKIDQSIAHNGICLTVVEINGNQYKVTAIEETIKRSNIGNLKVGNQVNVERCMPADGRFDGHIVQGHVDTTAICNEIKDLNGSWEFKFTHDKNNQFVTVEKGSITINGVSLTVVKSTAISFSVHIIPYTFEHTNFKEIKPGTIVNLEFDIVGKYVARLLNK